MKWRNFCWPVVMLSAILLSGCNLVSDPARLTQTQALRQVDPQGLQKVMAALRQMQSVHSYQMKAIMQVATGRFVRTVNFFGAVSLPSTISMDETIGGSNYLVYQKNQFAYFKNGNKWEKMAPLGDLRPWDSLTNLLKEAPPQVVYSLPQQTVVAWLCNVYQFKTKAKQGSLVERSGLFGAGSATIPHSALYTVWVDTTDGMLRQVEVQSTVGVPNLGTSSINGTATYLNFNQKQDVKLPTDLLAQVEIP